MDSTLSLQKAKIYNLEKSVKYIKKQSAGKDYNIYS